MLASASLGILSGDSQADMRSFYYSSMIRTSSTLTSEEDDDMLTVDDNINTIKSIELLSTTTKRKAVSEQGWEPLNYNLLLTAEIQSTSKYKASAASKEVHRHLPSHPIHEMHLLAAAQLPDPWHADEDASDAVANGIAMI